MLKGHDLGLVGEDLARDFLSRRGYLVREVRWRVRRWEIDLIAEKEGVLFFVEVKSRVFNPHGFPDDGLSSGQMKRIVKTAHCYLEQANWDGSWQFDLISVEWRGGGNYLLRHLRDLDFI